MNILLINHYAGSPEHGMEFRPWYLARQWVDMGHHVTIVAASYSHLRSQQQQTNGSCTIETRAGIRYCWLKTPKYQGNGIGRVLNMASFIAQLYRFLPSVVKSETPDAVIASSTYPLDIYPARWIAKRTKALLAFELHDLWPLSPMELGNMSPKHPFIRIMQKAEDYWCRHAERVISILPHADRHLVTRGMTQEKFVHIPNGIELGEWDSVSQLLPKEHQDFLTSAREKKLFCVGYTGGMSVSNALHLLINAAPLLREHANIHFILVGKGQQKELLQEQAEKLALSNVTFLPPLPKALIPTWLQQMDCLYMGAQKSPLYQYGVSLNKMFDYMMAGHPIVNAIEASNDPVSENNCGITVEAENPAAIAEAILKIYHLSPEERLIMGKRGHEYVLANHTYPALAIKFIEALER